MCINAVHFLLTQTDAPSLFKSLMQAFSYVVNFLRYLASSLSVDILNGLIAVLK